MLDIHGSCVAFGARGVLILGASGSGKSGLALQLIGLGASLVADDRTFIFAKDGWPCAKAPSELRGVIEARGLGLLQAETVPEARLQAVINMDVTERTRMPPDRTHDLLGCALPLLHKIESLHFAAAVRQYVVGGKAYR